MPREAIRMVLYFERRWLILNECTAPLQEELEEERRNKAGLVTRCKKLEHDLSEAQRAAEEAEKLRDEAAKSAKKAHQVWAVVAAMHFDHGRPD